MIDVKSIVYTVKTKGHRPYKDPVTKITTYHTQFRALNVTYIVTEVMTSRNGNYDYETETFGEIKETVRYNIYSKDTDQSLYSLAKDRVFETFKEAEEYAIKQNKEYDKLFANYDL